MTLIAVAENALDAKLLADTAAELDATITLGPVATPEQVASTAAGADALLVTLHPLRAEHVAALPDSVRVIARAGVGLDTVDVEAARERGIAVVYQPTYATSEVADQAASMALAAWRLVGNADRLVRDNGWATPAQVGPLHSLQDATLGVLGTGRIGRSLIARLTPFVSRVVAFDAYPDSTISGVEWAASAREVLERSNLLSLHLPLTDETHHVVDADSIEAMPNGAVLVNVSRGGLIDEPALVDALHSGKIAAAALDVFEQEPLPLDSALRTAPNLILSPHIAWYSIESAVRLTRWSVIDVVTFVRTGGVTNGQLA